MTLRERQSAFLLMIAKLIIYAETPLVLLQWKRTPEEQAVLVARGASQTLKSKHLDGLAMDFCYLNDLKDDGKINWDNERYRYLGEYWESLGGRWGGRFGDNPATQKIEGWDCSHFEYNG